MATREQIDAWLAAATVSVRYTPEIQVVDLLVGVKSSTGHIGVTEPRNLRVDLNTGLPFVIREDGTCDFMTPCCTAAQTYPGDGGPLCCKVCWNEVDSRLDRLISTATPTH